MNLSPRWIGVLVDACKPITLTEFRNLNGAPMNFCLLIILTVILQSACCQHSFTYPVIGDVTKITVTTSDGSIVAEVTEIERINEIIRFVDERRSQWCSRRSAVASAFVNFSGREGDKGKIGLHDGVLLAEFAGGKYEMSLSEDEWRDFSGLLEIDRNAIKK